MTAQQIESTLYNLRYAIEKQRHIYGNDGKIMVRIGRELAAWIRGYNKMYIMNYADGTMEKTIFGYPLEIEYKNPMCLEVCVVEPVYVDGGNNGRTNNII